MHIIFIASESRPFIKTGGLADVIYSLGEELSFNNEVSVIIPFYSKIKEDLKQLVDYLGSFVTHIGFGEVETKVCSTKYKGITFYFIENDYYFARSQLYNEPDDGERFAFFSLASIELIKHFNLKPDIVHVHDWHVALVPCVIKVNESEYFKNTKTVLTIHNPAFQGFFNKDFILNIYRLPYEIYEDGSIRYYDQVSTLKAGIMYADKIIAVSANHREELLTREGGYGLDECFRIREKDFIGILNGIDYSEFNPNTDKNIKITYNITSFYDGKCKNKEFLLNKFGLNNSSTPLFGMVSRLTSQKGIASLFPMIRNLTTRGACFIILGSGDRDLELGLEDIRREFPNNVGIYIGYNEELAHLIYAGSDFILMPSLFEPCGLAQLISERYGALPLVRLTGGLKDSVVPYDNENLKYANGFGYAPNDVDEFIRTVHFAFDVYWNLPVRKQLITNAMNTDNSWTVSAKKYLKVYKDVLTNK